MAIEERVEPTRKCSPVTVLGRPGSISEPAEGVTRWLSVQKCLIRKKKWPGLFYIAIPLLPFLAAA